MKQAAMIIDVRPAYQGVKSIIAKVEMRRRGVRILASPGSQARPIARK
ncbi:TPA: hypothetical protein ACQ49P_005751 [Pseudomonas aeruginosa]